MAKVKQVVARKDYPQFGIKKGDRHYTWSLMLGPRTSRTYRQIDPPRPSQLTTSEFLGSIGDMELEFDSMTHDESLPDTLREFAERLRELASAEEEKFENLPENFQNSSNGEMLQERADNCNSWADEIDQAADALDDKLGEIAGKDWHELDEFSHIDPEDEDFDESEVPSDDEIEAAKDGERGDAYEEAIEAASSCNPGF